MNVTRWSVLALSLLFLTACFGGGGGSSGSVPVFMPEHLEVPAPPEAFPELPLQQPAHAAQAPIVDLQGILHVGANVAPPSDQLTKGGTYSGIAVSSGLVRDGEGAYRVLEYLNKTVDSGLSRSGEEFTFERYTVGLATFPNRPTLRLAEGTNDEFASYAVRAVQLINAALPHEKRIVFGSETAPPLAAIKDIPDGEIHIDFAPFADWNDPNKESTRPGTEAAAQHADVQEFNVLTQRWESKRKRAAHIWFDPERTSNFSEESKFSIVLHEIMHALGHYGHQDSARFPDSIMRDRYLLITSELPAIDREALLAMYGRFDPGTSPEELSMESLGPWADTSFHLRGDLDIFNGQVSFGVASRNGLSQPWASGPTPYTNLVDNALLSETVSWEGRLLGMTPHAAIVGGTADLSVELETLTGDLDFTSLEMWRANVPFGTIGTGAIWGDGDLRYTVGIRGNTFVQTGGDEGTVTGAFFGVAHEGMGGVLERSDLAAAFGGERQ